MFVYNITLNMEYGIEVEALIWVENIFIPYVMKRGIFHEFQLCKLNFIDQYTPAYAIQFYCSNDADKDLLLEKGQTQYIEMVLEKWGLQVMPFATIMDIMKPAYLSFIHQN
ncbi:MAG: DUF4286 family protein [Saprospiraceae bacterium]